MKCSHTDYGAHDNVNSLVNKMNYILSVVQFNDLHVLAIPTKLILKDTILFRRASRNRRGKGLICC